MTKVFTQEELIALGDEVRSKGLLIRHWSGVIVPDTGGTVVGAVYAAAAEFTPGTVVSAPILITTQFGTAIHQKATIEANTPENIAKGHPPLMVRGTNVFYPIVPDTSVDGWRPAVKGLDTP